MGCIYGTRTKMTWDDLEWFQQPHSWLNAMSEFPVCPKVADWFKAFDLTPLEKVRVVILGQDPYPTPGHATGLAFSVPPHLKKLPPTLENIFTEYRNDLHYPRPTTGDLSPWAANGVLLLNTSLTCDPGKPGSHSELWDRELIPEVLDVLVNRRPSPVFILWGSHARTVFGQRDASHIVSVHPSPLSARRGFFGSRPFTTCNGMLVQSGQQAVN